MARLNPTTFGEQNFYSATLTADITAGSLTISLDTVPTPTSGILVIEPDSTTNREVILYTGKTASTITLPSDGRGFDGSTAVSHLTGTTIIYAPVKRLFEALASGELSTDPLRTEAFGNFIASGLVWTADAAGSTRNASQSSGVLYILGRRLTAVAVSARTFTASRDTYVDATDNGDGTALIAYNEVTNGAASPALATNAVRLAKIVTGASSIAAASSITQGGVDSLGNVIKPAGAVQASNINFATFVPIADANGWQRTPYDGIKYRYTKTLTGSTGSLVAGGGAAATLLDSSSLPVGVSTLTGSTVTMRASVDDSTGNAPWILFGFGYTSTNLRAYARNGYGGGALTASYTLVVEVIA